MEWRSLHGQTDKELTRVDSFYSYSKLKSTSLVSIIKIKIFFPLTYLALP